LYLVNNNEFPTTVASLNAIAPAAKNGKKEYISGPKKGTKIPAAIGTNAVLYPKVQGKAQYAISVLNGRDLF